MSTMKIYSNIAPVLNGELLKQSHTVKVEKMVNGPVRVTVESAVPEGGIEFDGYQHMRETPDEMVTLDVVQIAGSARPLDAESAARLPGIVRVEGKVVAGGVRRKFPDPAVAFFTVEESGTPG